MLITCRSLYNQQRNLSLLHLKSSNKQKLYPNYININIQHHLIRSISSKIDNEYDTIQQNLTIKQKIKAYLDLSKFRLSSLVVLTTAAGFICTGMPLNYPLMASACFGTALW